MKRLITLALLPLFVSLLTGCSQEAGPMPAANDSTQTTNSVGGNGVEADRD